MSEALSSEHPPAVPTPSPTDERADEWYQETVAFLGMATIPGIGYWTLNRIRKSGHLFLDILRQDSREAFNDLVKEHGGRGIRELPADWGEAQRWIWASGKRSYKHLASLGVCVLHSEQPAFPRRLREISDPPQWLFCQGNVALLNRVSVTLVGTRRPSPDGEFLTKYLVALLARFSVPTISGLAEGIDRSVHEYSLRFQLPTVAVLGTGILQDFPADSPPLRRAIIEQGGVVVTEYLPSQTYSKENFVRRNRLQAGLGKVVVPLEWRAKSGTAHTVRYAAEQGRPILCLRLPDWDASNHQEVEVARELGGTVFTVPGEEAEMLEHLGQLLDSSLGYFSQLSLF